ncbi:MAG: hypothetical protein V3R71_01600 [Gemmatimonadales bacterium]
MTIGATDIGLTGQSRVFFTRDLAGPANRPSYKGRARSQGISWSNGDLSPVRIPSRDRYDQFDIVEVIQGQQGLPQLPIMFRYARSLSELLDIFRIRCPIDLEVHFGKCERPDDYLAGWVKDGKIVMVDQAYPLDYGTDDLGAFDGDDQAVINETMGFTGVDLYEVVALQPALQAGDEITDPIIAVSICDSISCGSCGIPSDGCEKVFALTSGVSGSPGLPLEIIFTSDKGANYSATNITSAGLGEAGNDMTCVGSNLMVVTDADQHHYADIQDIIDGVETWTVIAVGYVAAGTPNAIFSLGREKTWIAADAGFIYFSADITTSVTPQTEGGITSENLNDIHGDSEIVIAVGDSNTVLITESDGAAWTSITGPSVGNDLTSIEVITKLVWFIGDSNGDLWYTINGGVTWTQKAFPNDGDGSAVADIEFVNRRIGYMAHGTELLRTFNGGSDWVVEPQNSTFIFPTNTVLNSIGVCKSDANLYFAGGADGADGVLVKGAAV